jgi:hypothetical protein
MDRYSTMAFSTSSRTVKTCGVVGNPFGGEHQPRTAHTHIYIYVVVAVVAVAAVVVVVTTYYHRFYYESYYHDYYYHYCYVSA